MSEQTNVPEADDELPHSLIQRFGAGLRQQRRKRGWTQENLAQLANLNRSYIGEIERGTVIPSLLTVGKLADALSVSPSELVSHGELPSENEACLEGN